MSTPKFAPTGLNIGQSRNRLAGIWVLGGLPLLVIVIVQIVLGRYPDGFQTPIGWLSTLLFPSWSIIFAVLTVGKTKASIRPVHHKSLFYISALISVVYIISLYLIMFLGVYSPGGLSSALQNSAFYMGVFQSFVIGVVGKFFLESQE